MEIEIFRVGCGACNEIFNGMSLEEAEEKHQQHIKICQTIIALEKIERFRKEVEKILGRKVTFKEAGRMMGCKI